MEPDKPGLQEAAARLRAARRTVALTGAGMSVESGIPPFRGGAEGGGLWDRYDPMEYGTIEAFRHHPAKAWMMLRELSRTLSAAAPHAGHRALAHMEENGWLGGVITQNIDGLHQAAGSRRVLEFHGSWRTMTCMGCRTRVPSGSVPLEESPPACSQCSGPLKPDVILFGEIIPAAIIDRAVAQVRSSDCLVVVGTSAEVVPASLLPAEARRGGAFIIEVNTQESALTRDLVDLKLTGPAGVVLPALLDALTGTKERP